MSLKVYIALAVSVVSLGVAIVSWDCPVDLTGLTSHDRALVMIDRPDCPIDLTGLRSSDRSRVMANRPDYTAP